MEYIEFQLCREFGWTFNELEEQPAEKIEQALLFMNREYVYQKSQQDSANSGSKTTIKR